jgi:hypothetical protein
MTTKSLAWRILWYLLIFTPALALVSGIDATIRAKSADEALGQVFVTAPFCVGTFLLAVVVLIFCRPIPGYDPRGEVHFSLGVQRRFPHVVAGGNYSGISPLAPKPAVANMGGDVDDRERRLACSYDRS